MAVAGLTIWKTIGPRSASITTLACYSGAAPAATRQSMKTLGGGDDLFLGGVQSHPEAEHIYSEVTHQCYFLSSVQIIGLLTVKVMAYILSKAMNT